MKIAFHSNHISLRGTEVAIYDYAHYNETLLGNKSIILIPAKNAFDVRAYERVSARFPVFLYESWSHAESILKENEIDVLYCIKQGDHDGIVSSVCKTVVHVVFGYREPHGDVYAYISQWLARAVGKPDERLLYVPHIVTPPIGTGSLRTELGIPNDAIVFGRYGGTDTFDIDFVQFTVQEVARRDPNRYFIFMNTDRFCEPTTNIIFLEGSAEVARKEAFIGTCDAMLHGRRQGESFGLAVAEFSIRNKPILTWLGSPEKNHIDVLRERGIYYFNANDLYRILLDFKPDPSRNWDAYSERFSPEVVMRQFKEVFLSNTAQDDHPKVSFIASPS